MCAGKDAGRWEGGCVRGRMRGDGREDVCCFLLTKQLALSCKHDIGESAVRLPYCAFNGGRDVWVDVGNKFHGVTALQAFLQVPPQNSLHVGDQFLSTGNDVSTRMGCCTCWVSNPRETESLLAILLPRERTPSPSPRFVGAVAKTGGAGVA
jgi:hypothetical protein